MRPKVSIIMPIYNVEKYLQQSLTSVCNQTMREIEIICINDGSSDSSLEILNYFASKDSRIKIFTTKNMGYGHAMNLGLEMSNGEYIGIVEPDDYVDCNMFEYLYDVAKLKSVDIVKADFRRFKTPLNSEMITVSNNIRFNESCGASFQDNGFWFQTLCFCNAIYYVQIPFYMNRRDNENSSVNQLENIYSANKEFEFIYNIINNSSEMKKKFLNGYHIKKYQTYKFNLNRCSENMIREYVECISNEWGKDIEKGELRKEIFKNEEWEEIMQIVNNPQNYIISIISQRNVKTEQSVKNVGQLEFELGEIRNSISYKIGLLITKIPRKIIAFKENRNDK